MCFIDNVKLIAENMTTIYKMLKKSYNEKLTEKQMMYASGIIQCACAFKNGDIQPIEFSLAMEMAKFGECGLGMYSGKIHGKEWFNKLEQTNMEIFCNYVMNIECLFLYYTSNLNYEHEICVDAVIRKKKKIYNTVEKTFNKELSSFRKKILSAWINYVMNSKECESWRKIIFEY